MLFVRSRLGNWPSTKNTCLWACIILTADNAYYTLNKILHCNEPIMLSDKRFLLLLLSCTRRSTRMVVSISIFVVFVFSHSRRSPHWLAQKKRVRICTHNQLFSLSDASLSFTVDLKKIYTKFPSIILMFNPKYPWKYFFIPPFLKHVTSPQWVWVALKHTRALFTPMPLSN